MKIIIIIVGHWSLDQVLVLAWFSSVDIMKTMNIDFEHILGINIRGKDKPYYLYIDYMVYYSYTIYN